jgi:hypothetical protein
MLDERTTYLIQLYKHYQQGILPGAGGLLDQPNVFKEAMDVINGC